MLGDYKVLHRRTGTERMNKLKRTKKVIMEEAKMEKKKSFIIIIIFVANTKTNFSFKSCENVKGICHYWESFWKMCSKIT